MLFLINLLFAASNVYGMDCKNMDQPVTKECYQLVQEQFKAENQSYFF